MARKKKLGWVTILGLGGLAWWLMKSKKEKEAAQIAAAQQTAQNQEATSGYFTF